MFWFLADKLRGKLDHKLIKYWKFGRVTVNWTNC